MKKSLKTALMSLILVLCLPLALVLSGCGATPSNETRGIYFVSSTYDEETGYAVFEVDLNVATPLTYKLNPSSASGYEVKYAVVDSLPDNLSRFTLEKGIITVENSQFHEIKVSVTSHSYKDVCIVRLKTYPKSMFLYKADGVSETTELEISMNAKGTYTISPFGRYFDISGKSYVKPLLEYDYNFKVETSDPTIIDVPIENRLKINAVTDRPAQAVVTVSLFNAANQVAFSVKIKVNVVLNAKNAEINFENGYDTFVKSGDVIEIDASRLDTDDSGNYILRYSTIITNAEGRVIENSNVSSICTVSNTNYISYSETEPAIIIATAPSDLTFNFGLWTNLIEENGLPFVIKVTITIKY